MGRFHETTIIRVYLESSMKVKPSRQSFEERLNQLLLQTLDSVGLVEMQAKATMTVPQSKSLEQSIL